MSILEKVKEVGSNCVSKSSNVLSYYNVRRAYKKDGKSGVEGYLKFTIRYEDYRKLVAWVRDTHYPTLYTSSDIVFEKMVSEIVREFNELEIRESNEFFKISNFGMSCNDIPNPLFSFTGTSNPSYLHFGAPSFVAPSFSENKFIESNILKKAFVEFEFEGRKVMVGAVSFKGSREVKLGYSVCMPDDLENYKASISKKICIGRAIKKAIDSVSFGYSEKDILGDYGVLKSIASRTAKKIVKGDIVIKGIKPLKK